jgi:hypothetical protein
MFGFDSRDQCFALRPMITYLIEVDPRALDRRAPRRVGRQHAIVDAPLDADCARGEKIAKMPEIGANNRGGKISRGDEHTHVVSTCFLKNKIPLHNSATNVCLRYLGSKIHGAKIQCDCH